MRIIAGKFGGRKLKVYPAAQMRPTTDRVREAVFSTLQGLVDLERCTAFDLYCGTGSLGLEALSRGAQAAVFVEEDPRLCNALKKNLELLEVSGGVHIIEGRIPAVLHKLSGRLGAQPERPLFLIDPPYKAHPGIEILVWLADAGILCSGSTVVLGAPKQLNLELTSSEMERINLSLLQQKVKTYGDTRVNYYQF